MQQTMCIVRAGAAKSTQEHKNSLPTTRSLITILAYHTRALHHVRLKREQDTEALWSYVISIEKCKPRNGLNINHLLRNSLNMY